MQSNLLLGKRILKTVGYILIVGFSFLVIFYLCVSGGAFGHIHSEEELKDFENELATTVLSDDGITLGRYFSKNREKIEFDSIPQHLLNCLVATEDVRYYKHDGVDGYSMFRVVFKSLILRDKSSGGGSTITQQLAKNMYGRKSYGFLTMPVIKTKEIILASRLEEIYSKDEILGLYLNTVAFGENIYGIQSASKRFFNKPANQLKIEEGAVLIGMLKANTYYNPRLHKENALTRRNVVLKQTLKSEYISNNEFDSLKHLPLELDYMNLKNEGPANYFLSYVKKQAKRIIATINDTSDLQIDLETDGLTIKTTLNYNLQKQANAAFKEHLSIVQKHLRAQYKKGKYKQELNKISKRILKKKKLKNEIKNRDQFSWKGFYTDSISTLDSIKYALTQLHGGFLTMEPTSGAIRSWVGGINFASYPYDQVRAKRQLASTFKPLLYAAAVEGGRRPCDYISNDEIKLTDYENWSPSNYDHSSGGKYSIAAALSKSKNIPAVRTYFETGFEKVNRLWTNMGFSSKIEDQPSLALGTATGSVLELAAAYSSFVNEGRKTSSFCISEIKDKKGKIIYRHENIEHEDEVMDHQTANTITAILKKAINEGTGTPIRTKYGFKGAFAGKTGTSQNYSDAWFVGFNDKIIMISRVGANSPAIHFKSGEFGSGSRLALPIVGKTLQKSVLDKSTKRLVNGGFNDEVNEVNLNCSDFIEENQVDKFFKKFQKKDRSLEDEKRRAKRRKRNPLKRILKW